MKKVYLYLENRGGRVKTSNLLLDDCDTEVHIVVGDKDYWVKVLDDSSLKFPMEGSLSCRGGTNPEDPRDHFVQFNVDKKPECPVCHGKRTVPACVKTGEGIRPCPLCGNEEENEWE